LTAQYPLIPRTSKKPPVKSMLTPAGLLRSRKAITVSAAPPKAEMILSVFPTLISLEPVPGGSELASASVLLLVVNSVVSILNQVKLFELIYMGTTP
jgi:hypothetical protein